MDLTSSVATWKALPSLFNNSWIPVALKIGGHVTIGEATIEEVRSGSKTKIIINLNMTSLKYFAFYTYNIMTVY